MGEPKILYDVDPDNLRFDKLSLVHCRVEPPKAELMPILPYKTTGNLLFALCEACALEGDRKLCEHDQLSRSFIGVYTSVELEIALKQGYKITS
ncbi:MAG: hypothetical protein GY740_00885 [Gammaproteobacteria bacterium]|nr:hypothetical protein [Gammaproteobacteria bacterium]